MALAILDGTQTATTLSTILSSGQHITAHTVVSLGTQAITDMRSAVSGSVVSIPSLPAISGTVTAYVFGKESFENTFVPIQIGASGESFTNGNRIGVSIINDAGTEYGVTGSPLSISGMVSVGNVIPGLADGDGTTFGIDRTFPISGTVDIGTALPAGTAQIGSVTASNLTSALAVYSGGNTDISVNIKSVGGQSFGQGQTYVPVAITEGSLPAGTNRIGVVTIGAGTVTIGAGTAQIGSVTVGNSVTIGSLPALVAGTAQIGSVTASLAISSTAITSGSFTSLTSATLVPANTARKMATVYNLGAGQLFVNAGVTATTLGGGFMVALNSGDFYECNYTTTTLSAIFATAGTASWISH